MLFQALVGFGLALLLRAKFKASGLLTTLILIPMMLSPVVVGQFWKLIFNPLYGIFQLSARILELRPQRPDWLKNHALISVVIADVWMWSPFVMLLCLSGLKAIPDYIYEAAAVDRASSWRQFWRITLPSVAPLLTLAVLFRTIEALKAFDLVMGLTGGGPGNTTETVSVALYRMVFQGQARTGHGQRARLHHADRDHRHQQRVHLVSEPDEGGMSMASNASIKRPLPKPGPARPSSNPCAWTR